MLDKTSDKANGKPADKKEPVVVKKYANRRLYNTETSTYVTLDDLASMVRSERDFVVYDAKSGDDLTHSVLTQIIVEQEASMGTGQTMLPIPFLRQLIRFYGDNVGKLVPSYLQVSLDTLAREQTRIREQFASAFSPQHAIEAYQEQARKNLAMFEQAMKMFSPFGSAATQAAAAEAAKETPAAPASPAQKPEAAAAANSDQQMAEMRSQLATMQAMLDKLAKDRG